MALCAFAGLLACTGPEHPESGGEASATGRTAQAEGEAPADGGHPTVGRIVARSAELEQIIPAGTPIEKLAEGFTWSEGPVWIGEGGEADGHLLFTDVPENVVYRWSSRDGLDTFLDPAVDVSGRPETFREAGLNGLIRGEDAGVVLAASHGERAVVRLVLENRERSVLVEEFQGQSLNSPNDLVLASDGSLYFTDPPYGLSGLGDSPDKELDVHGVYRLDADGELELLDGDLTFPNGIALSPDEKTLYVAQSDPEAARWMRYRLDGDGAVAESSVLLDLTERVADDAPGLPDGMAVDREGRLYATGPGAVFVLSPEGRILGEIQTGTAAANCAFGDDGGTLYITSGPLLVRVRTRTRGLGF